MIKIDKVPILPTASDYDVYIDDVLVTEGVFVGGDYKGRGLYDVRVTDEKLFEQFTRYSILDLFPITCLRFKWSICGDTPINVVQIRPSDTRALRPDSYIVALQAQPDLATWTKPYSFTQYREELSRQLDDLNSNSNYGARLSTNEEDNRQLQVSAFSFDLPLSTPALPLSPEISRHADTFRTLHDKIEVALLLPTLSSNAMAVFFNFPEQVKVPCEQYLIYFVQFLRDLGVEATSDLRHEAGRVLFTVTPKDPLEALENIRTALQIYLRLPSGPISDKQGIDNDIATQKLVANIHHLTGQLSLARAVIEAKNATIQAQQVTINQTLAFNQNAITANIVVDSIVRVLPQPKERDKEEFLGGTFAVTKYEGKGFEINIPELIRRLKRRFGKSD